MQRHSSVKIQQGKPKRALTECMKGKKQQEKPKERNKQT
jgi:hypothetical protein